MGAAHMRYRNHSIAMSHASQPQNVRKITGSFAWIDHRLLRNGYLQQMTHEDLALYLFLILAADRYGVSFYRKEKICDAVGLDFRQFEIARDRLISLRLIAFQTYTVLSPNGYYQVLPIQAQAPNLAKGLFHALATQGPTPSKESNIKENSLFRDQRRCSP